MQIFIINPARLLYVLLLPLVASAGEIDLTKSLGGTYQDSKIKAQFGFRAIDFSADMWPSISDTYRYKGKVGDVIRYADMEEIIVLRLHMAIPSFTYLENTLAKSIAEKRTFHSQTLPSRFTNNNRQKEVPIVTVLFRRGRDEYGVLSIYSGYTLLQLDGKYGIILEDS